jgi:2-amino-4-hydroxy-6-hydroxymethyldihydropteridine diphosphokinase
MQHTPESASLWQTVYLGLGSNLGDRVSQLEQAVSYLAAMPGARVLRQSDLFETAPVGPVPQPDFLNQVVEITTVLQPLPLLETLKAYERVCGREVGLRWGPRVIDLDILLWGSLTLDSGALVIPHRELCRRAFVLEPLAQLAPDAEIPGEGQTVTAFLGRVEGREGVRLFRQLPRELPQRSHLGA